MDLPCEDTSSPCPVRFPATCPPPRCDCQDLTRHCRLCHLPFDIENHLNGLGEFCSCFLGESSVGYAVPIVCWMPVLYFVPICGYPSAFADTHRRSSNSSSLGTGSNHSLPSTVDACLDGYDNPSRKQCVVEASNESDHCSSKNSISDSVESDISLPKGLSSDSSTASSHFTEHWDLDSLAEFNSSLLLKDNIVAKDSDQKFLSDEAIQLEDSNSLETKRDNVNSDKGIFTELKPVIIPPADSLSRKGTHNTSSYSEGNELCKNENLKSKGPAFCEVNSLEASREAFSSTYNKSNLDDRSLLLQGSRDINLTGYTNATEPFNRAENETIPTFQNLNQNYTSRIPMVEQKPLFSITNDADLNTFEPNTSCLGDRPRINRSAEPNYEIFVPLNASYAKNSNENICNYAESKYPSHTLHVSASNTNSNNFWPMNPYVDPCLQGSASLEPFNWIQAESNIANAHNYEESRDPSNSHVAQIHYQFQHQSIDTRMQHERRFEAASQHGIASGGNELNYSFQASSVQPNRTASSSLYQSYWPTENSSIHPSFNTRGNVASSDAGTDIGLSATASRSEFSAESRVGILEGCDLVQEILSINKSRSNRLAELIRDTK